MLGSYFVKTLQKYDFFQFYNHLLRERFDSVNFTKLH
jgi:hypothetical protein